MAKISRNQCIGSTALLSPLLFIILFVFPRSILYFQVDFLFFNLSNCVLFLAGHHSLNKRRKELIKMSISSSE